ncbi:hypothetical protein BD310DRAFT_831621 [Dichomitus squalens]|uniref:IMD domain-containing protein n=1 Tax=Dichomitus squalens TaxID=114155 RepID=A0A4Q9PHZ8_9APHY|nr:hypothetical protein BD310DRAFT_831621 [Dichomitus squalens]
MANSSGPLAERSEIHKSCKTLESVVNILNDYCEAANAIVALQKKLAKALRESAAVKCVAEIPGNALITSATIFESMAEVDSKFAKFADKECDSVSAEVKKWFKKLAKEERTHDEKIASANQKIKQAGQIYERKAKKYPRDAAEEHTRYMNLLSTLGPEVNREKYNHALLVTQKHTSTMYNLASSLSRVADAEWMRSCESVRRYSPTIGQLGQWKALCEGGWSGSVPPDLPDGNAAEPSASSSQPTGSKEQDSDDLNGIRDLSTPLLEKPAPEYTSRNASERESTSRAATPSGQSPAPPPQYFPPTPAAEPTADARPNSDTTSKEAEDRPAPQSGVEQLVNADERSATIDAFPAPPTHFPMPPANGSKFNSNANAVTTPSPTSPPTQEIQNRSEATRLDLPESSSLTPFPRFTESPTPESTSALTNDFRSPTRAGPLTTPADSNSVSLPDSNSERDREQGPPPFSYSQTSRSSQSYASSQVSRPTIDTEKGASRSTAEQVATPSPSVPTSYRRGDYMEDAEFGVRQSLESPRLRAAEPTPGRALEPNDTGRSNGSVVAALRDRYARGPGPTSPPPGPKSPPRELPRLPMNVSALANRYEPANGQSNVQRQATGSPTRERIRTSADTYSRMPEPSSTTLSTPSVSRYSDAPPAPTTDEIALRRQRIEELEELELREREHDLRMKEREIEQRARELERERLHLLNARGVRHDGYISDGSRATSGPRISTTQRPTSIETSPGSRYPSSYSQSTTHLVPPVSQQTSSSRTGSSQPSSPASQPADHAPYCGCESCSASKYKSRDVPSPRDLRPPEPPIQLRPDKPKGGWIRRLSMPVIPNAFSLDSKKGGVGIAGGPAAGYRGSMAFADEDGRLRTDLTGGIRNRSSTNLSRR